MPPIKGDENAIKQVFINIIKNAVQAVSESGEINIYSKWVSDIVGICGNLCNSNLPLVPNLYSEKDNLKLIDIKNTSNKYYLRFEVADKPGILGAITSILGKYGISIESMIQKRKENSSVPIVLMTHEANESELLKALKTISIFLHLLFKIN